MNVDLEETYPVDGGLGKDKKIPSHSNNGKKKHNRRWNNSPIDVHKSNGQIGENHVRLSAQNLKDRL